MNDAPVSNVEALRPFASEAPLGSTVIEVGSRDGHDAEAMRKMFWAGRVVTVEANPEMYQQIENTYPEFDNCCAAITDRNGAVGFNRVRSYRSATKIGQSSILNRDIYRKHADRLKVPGRTMDYLVDVLGITEIAAMKIDVEGATYQVLSGFQKLRMCYLLHIEAEHREYWKGQHQYEDVAALLKEQGFEQVHFEMTYTDQSDSVWRRVG